MTTLQNLLGGFRVPAVLTLSSRNRGSQAVSVIRERRSQLSTCDDQQLKTRAMQLRQLFTSHPAPDPMSLHIEALGLVDEAAQRSLGIRLYDVQFLAGLSLLRGEIAEMKTGEGKTYAGVLASFAYSLRGRGVHFMTTNDYLASRDHELVRPIFERLGCSLGLLRRNASPLEKQVAYACDVTYGPGYEFGFDYLRDQLALMQRPRAKLGEQYQALQRGDSPSVVFRIQREPYCAIIDEADSVLIDEATTPLILSGAASQACEKPEPYLHAKHAAARLRCDVHFTIDRSNRRLTLTRAGQEQAAGCLTDSTRRSLCRPWTQYVQQALHANHLLARNVDYVSNDGQVKIVDLNTGRVFEDRTWSEGLHQAVEAKEELTIHEENRSLARISRQQYFRIYDSICGMTGTAIEAAAELKSVYKLAVSEIPTHKPSCRRELPPRFFGDEETKWDAIVDDVVRIHQTGQPVLIGTRTIRQSETIAKKLDELALPYQLLNGKQDADEASLISRAGRPGAITIATNMAGRGTDIKLGENVADLGGLHVIVSEPHDSARVDRQLIGRSARQGDPGSCQLFVSAGDTVICQNVSWLARYLRRVASPGQEAGVNLGRDLKALQKGVERKQAAIRRKMASSEHWLEDVLSKLAKD